MKDHQKALTIAEQILLERFIQYDEKNLTRATQDVLNEFRNRIFIDDIFSIIVEDVLNVLSLTEWNQKTYEKIISSAKNIFETSGCFFPANQHFLFALPIVWITYCCKYCKYKEGFSILSPELKTSSIVSDSKVLEYSICAQFFNCFGGPPFGKAKKLEKYMFSTYGLLYRDLCENNNHLVNFQTLLYFLSLTNFSYGFLAEH